MQTWYVAWDCLEHEVLYLVCWKPLWLAVLVQCANWFLPELNSDYSTIDLFHCNIGNLIL